MWITFKRLFKPIVTVQYPRQKLTMTPNFRGHIEFIRFDDTKTHHCVACGLCARTCPSHVIKLQGEKTRAGDQKFGRNYFIDFLQVQSLRPVCRCLPGTTPCSFSREYELVFYLPLGYGYRPHAALRGTTMTPLHDFVPPIIVAQGGLLAHGPVTLTGASYGRTSPEIVHNILGLALSMFGVPGSIYSWAASLWP